VEFETPKKNWKFGSQSGSETKGIVHKDRDNL